VWARVESLVVQPPVMAFGPRFTVVVDDPVTQQQFRQPMSGPHQIRSGGFADADQIPGSLLGRTRNPHRHNLVQPQQPRQIQCVARIGFHPITSRAKQLG
jgi:hypothetical protein